MGITSVTLGKISALKCGGGWFPLLKKARVRLFNALYESITITYSVLFGLKSDYNYPLIQLMGLPWSHCESALAVRITKGTGSQNIRLHVSFSLKNVSDNSGFKPVTPLPGRHVGNLELVGMRLREGSCFTLVCLCLASCYWHLSQSYIHVFLFFSPFLGNMEVGSVGTLSNWL